MTSRAPKSAVAFAEHVLWATAAVCLVCCLILSLRAHAYHVLAQHIAQPQAISFNSKPDTAQTHHSASNPIGRIEVPALALSAPIAPDIDPGSLRLGVGHIRGTALPGGLGTVGLAGHRDSFFRPLHRIQPGMTVNLSGTSGTFHYIVDSTEIVTPDKVDVLDIASRPELTLITCFPFDFIGAAPRRFIVHAHLLSAAPDRPLPLR